MAYLNASYALADQFYGFEFPAASDLPDVSRTFALTEADRENVLDYLSGRPLHTVELSSRIYDHGVVSKANNGTFYAYHNLFGEIEGVALIGEDTYFESSSDEALAALAFTARKFEGVVKRIHSNDDLAIDLWLNAFGTDGPVAAVEHKDIFEMSFPAPVVTANIVVRVAEMNELTEVATIQARRAAAITGIDPLTVDGPSFLADLSRLIGLGRILVGFDGGEIAFVGELTAISDQAVILENLFVSGSLAATGELAAVLAQTGVELAAGVNHICIKDQGVASAVLARAGYRFVGRETVVTVASEREA